MKPASTATQVSTLTQLSPAEGFRPRLVTGAAQSAILPASKDLDRSISVHDARYSNRLNNSTAFTPRAPHKTSHSFCSTALQKRYRKGGACPPSHSAPTTWRAGVSYCAGGGSGTRPSSSSRLGNAPSLPSANADDDLSVHLVDVSTTRRDGSGSAFRMT